MARLFGTDGIRGIANIELTPELVYSVGYAHGHHLRRQGYDRPRVVVGRDTRISGQLLESSYAAGLCAAGADVELIGVIPTPAVAWYITHVGAQGGGVISASHNPVKDNGIKLLGSEGFKLSDEEENELEALIAKADSLERPSEGFVGRLYHLEREAEDAYVNYLVSLASERLEGMKFVIDCANGASSRVAPRVFKALGADLEVIHSDPDGLNINDKCGSTHMESLQERVVASKASFGLAFDGDADRCLAVDENGAIVDGDPLLLIFARYLRAQKRLPGDCVVTTVMANIGLEEALNAEGLKMVRTGVGDRYVLAEMLKLGGKLGGEQSGHIIFLDHATTGDGVLTGLMLSQIMAKNSRSLSELASDCHKKPQLLLNVRVKDKHCWREYKEVELVVSHIEEVLNGKGRLLVRPSGTENLLRLMAEGPDLDELQRLLNELRGVLEKCCPPCDNGDNSTESIDLAGYADELGELSLRFKKMQSNLSKIEQNGDLDKLSALARDLLSLSKDINAWLKNCKSTVTSWERYVLNERKKLQLEFWGTLRDVASKAGIEVAIITVTPPEFKVGKFTVIANYASGIADIQYCRLSVTQCALKASEVIDAVQKLEAKLNVADFSAEHHFGELLIAYKRRLILEGKSLSERVNLVDLVAEMAFQRQISSGVSKKNNFSGSYDRVQFAWDLMRMWRELHGLDCHGRRLNLGTATINSTKNKQSVLFLEEGGTRGQYYLSIWFTKQ